MNETDDKLNKSRVLEYTSTGLVVLIVLVITWVLLNGSELQDRAFSADQNIKLRKAEAAAAATMPAPANEPETVLPSVPEETVQTSLPTEPETAAAQPEAAAQTPEDEAPAQPTQENRDEAVNPTEATAEPSTQPTLAADETLPVATVPPGSLTAGTQQEQAAAQAEPKEEEKEYIILRPGEETAADTGSGGATAVTAAPSANAEVVYDPTALLPEGFVMFSQLDYPDERLGTGTVATNGCGITALAMVATYMTGHTFTPADLAKWFGGKAESNLERIELASTTLRLPWSRLENWHHVTQALEKGQIVILMVNQKSMFTSSQHFLVLLGFTDDGKVITVDPYAPNYENWSLKDGFARGFAEPMLIKGFDGAWAYNPKALPSNPYIYEPAPRRQVAQRYTDIELTQDEQDLLARLVFAEARGESLEGQQAVAEVVLNRLRSKDFPNTLSGVIYGTTQFASKKVIDAAKPSQAQYEAIENAFLGPYILPADVFYYARNPSTNLIWGKIGGHYFTYEP